MFKAHYGSFYVVIANQWYDLCTTDIEEAKLNPNEKSLAGYKRFMMAHFFMWQYPKNALTFGSRCGVCERLAHGEEVWGWVENIAALHVKMIVWKPNLNYTLMESTVEHGRSRTSGTIWTRKSVPTSSIKYEIAMSLLEPQCAWISGPHKGGMHDLTIFREGGLKQKIMRWKQAIVDRGYRTSEEDEKYTLRIPKNTDSVQLNEYKGRARLRHESFNGRLKKYMILDATFRHNQKYHGAVFRAVAVTVKYQINNGAPIFDVPMERELCPL